MELTINEILEKVIPAPNCCNQQRIELQRKAFAEWIEKHKDLGDNEIIYKLKKML